METLEKSVGTSSYLTFQESYNLPIGHSQAPVLISHSKKVIPTESVSMAITKSVQRGWVLIL